MVPSSKHKHEYVFVHFMPPVVFNPQSASSCAAGGPSSVHSFLGNCPFQLCSKMPPSYGALFLRDALPDGSLEDAPSCSLSSPINGQMGCFHFYCFAFAIINNTTANIFFCIWSTFLRIQPQKWDFWVKKWWMFFWLLTHLANLLFKDFVWIDTPTGVLIGSSNFEWHCPALSRVLIFLRDTNFKGSDTYNNIPSSFRPSGSFWKMLAVLGCSICSPSVRPGSAPSLV